MAQLVIYTSKRNWNEIIHALDESKYFLLDNQSCTRRELFDFALACGLQQGMRTPLDGKKDLFRNERIENFRQMYNAVYFADVIGDDTERIAEIMSDEAVFPIVEEYAETGFSVIRDAFGKMSEDAFTQQLIAEIQEIYQDFKDEYESF